MCLGLTTGYVPEKKESVKTTSLLKRKTNFDKIKDMTINELAVFYPCPYSREIEDDECKNKNCITCTKQWLESEVEGCPTNSKQTSLLD